MKTAIWTLWGLLTVGLLGYFANQFFFEEQKEVLLIGETTYGHYQIEMSCSTCHTEPFGGEEVIQDACTSCHAEELKAAHDSHPRKKFTDPRNADLLEIIDARYCVSCHTEHQQEQTHEMGLTLPEDYCFHCHEGVVEERESHAGLAFDSCASAGCHNYHDNRALYESFLLENANQPWLKEMNRIAQASSASYHAKKALSSMVALQTTSESMPHGEDFLHFQQGVGCQACHVVESEKDSGWLAKPSVEQCQTCHQKEVEGFKQSRHGMRLEAGLESMTPAESKALDFHGGSLETKQSCNTCHRPHDLDREFASTQACLGCHQDEHSLAFEASPHANLGSQEFSCASCHLPRVEEKLGSTTLMRVEHNQNAMLRPNEKMIRPVCMQCHSLEFSIDALADEALIKRNFAGKPAEHIPSIDWAKARDEKP